ncbi:MAG: YgiQ family radical SAM protein [Oscillospiraceae bacterium]|nr:YgiQ family radical SAM protein [Oscillospiraceae bacterium]
MHQDFLPISRDDMLARDWHYYDFLLVTGDAYVDHPSFGAAVIGRVLEREGYRIAILPQPQGAEDLRAIGKPRYGVLVTAGNLDSMVAHYTAAKKRRSEDYYSPDKRAGLRPDRACIVYSQWAREAFSNVPIVLGGLEASLRRFAHYDYWQNRVRRSILFDAKADLLVYGMGERSICEVAARLKSGTAMDGIAGTAYITKSVPDSAITCASYEDVCVDKFAYAQAVKVQVDECDPVRGRVVAQAHGDRFLIVNPFALPLTGRDLDATYELPYTRLVHPSYAATGMPVAALEEVQFSVTHNRGCFGDCNFCALSFHQGKMVGSRTHESITREVEMFTQHPQWKGYVHDVGGPTANFRRPSCQQQLNVGLCRSKKCLVPEPCKHLDADHSDYLQLLRKLRGIDGVKKVFIRSGIRFDYLMQDKSGECFAELLKYHISGQLKVAPEHCVDSVLAAMGKPRHEVYEKFAEKYKRLNQKYGKEQYLVPYLMSGHPGTTLQDAVALALYLHKAGKHPEQVQDFYPTPGTISTCMYYTGLNPLTMQQVHVPDGRERSLQRALLQWRRPEKRKLVIAALREVGREDLIGFSKGCLVRPLSRK